MVNYEQSDASEVITTKVEHEHEVIMVKQISYYEVENDAGQICVKQTVLDVNLLMVGDYKLRIVIIEHY